MQPNQKLPGSFCSMPWINLSTDVTGSLRPCCKFAQPDTKNEFQLPNMKDGKLDELWNHIEFQRLRTAFLDGEKPKDCKACWDEEAADPTNNNVSYRQKFAKAHQLNDNLDFQPVIEQGPMALDLKLNNVCNLKCRICGPTASSTFTKEVENRFSIKLDGSEYWLQNKIIDTENESVFREWMPNIQHVEITGGEPMNSQENLKILELLSESGYASNISVLLNTNVSVLNKKIINSLIKFKKVRIHLSVDDLGKRIEYQRFPCVWSTIEDNLTKYKELHNEYPHIELVLFCTVSNLNIFYLNEYLEWAEPTGIEYYWNVLHNPPEFSIKNLSTTVKDTINQKYRNNIKLQPVVDFMNISQEQDIFEKFKSKISDLDRARKQSFADVFPEWSAALNYKDINSNFEEFTNDVRYLIACHKKDGIALPHDAATALIDIAENKQTSLTKKLKILVKNQDYVRVNILEGEHREKMIPDNFCLYPFQSMNLDPDGSVRPCCKFNVSTNEWHDITNKTPTMSIDQLFNQPWIQELREEFLAGGRPKACKACWDEEAAGMTSMRLSLDNAGRKSPLTTIMSYIDQPSPKFLDLKLSSICNLKCRICNGYLSTRWLEESTKLGLLDDFKIRQYKNNAREKFIENPHNLEIIKEWAKTLENIQFYGGEPLLQTEHDIILKTIIETGHAGKIEIWYNTNTTICNKELFELWKHFKCVNLSLSIDDINERAEYERHPIKWSTTEENVKKFVEYQSEFNVRVNCQIVTTVSVFNVLYLDELFEWNKTHQNLTFILNMVHFPTHFSIKNFPESFKAAARAKLESYKKYNYMLRNNSPTFDNLISYLEAPADPELISIFRDSIQVHDEFRKEEFNKTFPLLSGILDE